LPCLAGVLYAGCMADDRTIETVTSAAAIPEAARTLALAFQDDPAFAWIVPDAEQRRAMLPHFFTVMAKQSLRKGAVLASRQREAASLWYPPGEVKQGMLANFIDNMRLARIFGSALSRGLTVGEAMYKRHPNPQPYAYLRYVGVSPQAQGKGWGGVTIREGIARAARRGQGVLLETATESNVAIYTRLGFETVEEWQVPGGGPQFWTMAHPAP